MAFANLASHSGSMGCLATAPSSLTDRVVPLKEDASGYDMDNNFSWKGDDSGVDVGDIPI